MKLHLLPPPVLCLSVSTSCSQPVVLSDHLTRRWAEEHRGTIAAHGGERETERELSFSPNLDSFTYKLWLLKLKPKPKPGFWTDFFLIPPHCYLPRFFGYLFGINSPGQECVYLGERARVPWVMLVPGRPAASDWDTTWRAPIITGAAPANTCSEKSWQSAAAVMPGSEVSDSGVLVLTVL